MPRYSIGRGALNGAASGGARLMQAILGADNSYQSGYDRTALAQGRLAQSEASADKSEASAAQTEAETRILSNRPDVFNETLAARAGTTVPKVQAYRNFINTGVMPDRQLPGPPTEQGIGPGNVPLVEPEVGERLSRLIGRMAMLQGNVKDVNPEQLADADDTYGTMDLRDQVLAGVRNAADVTEAQRAAKGSDLFKQAGNGSVIDVTTGKVDQTSPIAAATVGLKQAQAEKAQKAPAGKASTQPVDRDQVGILSAELFKTRESMKGAQGEMLTRLQGDEAALIAELKRAGIKDLGQLAAPKPGKGGVTKPPTEGQAKALMFGSRMAVADEIIKELSAKGQNSPNLLKQGLEKIPGIGGALGMGANFGSTAGQQQVEQAQRDFINAVLRRESGAAIADSEFANARQQYFPQPGDSPQVIAQKAANRMTAIEGMKSEFGEQGLPVFLSTVRGARAARQQSSKTPGVSANQGGNSPVGVTQRNIRVDF